MSACCVPEVLSDPDMDVRVRILLPSVVNKVCVVFLPVFFFVDLLVLRRSICKGASEYSRGVSTTGVSYADNVSR
eukprot:3234044-Prorocentrum_lima.AAC.1